MCKFLTALFTGICAGATLGGVFSFVSGCVQSEIGPIRLGPIHAVMISCGMTAAR